MTLWTLGQSSDWWRELLRTPPHPQEQRIRDEGSGDKTPTPVCALLEWTLRSCRSNTRAARDTMDFWKFFPFLALSSMWVLCLASSLQAAPFRSASESSLDLGTLSNQEKHLLLAALMQDYEQKARKLEQEEQETVGSSVASQKRSCNTATCVTHRLAGLLSRSGGVVKDNFVPTNVGSEAFGRRRRDLQA